MVIDLQEKLLAALPRGEDVVTRAIKLVRMARLLDIPVFVTEQLPDKLGPTTARLAKYLDNTPRRTKTAFSSSGALPDPLPRHLVACGIEAHVCVRQTVYDLRRRERVVYLAADAVTSRDERDERLAIEEMRGDKVLVTSAEAVCWEWLADAAHPKFKEALAILK